MPRNGSGTYSLPAGNPVVTGTTVSSTVQNTTMSDIATALTQSLTIDGQAVPTANLPMGGFKLTGLGSGSSLTDSANFGQTINMPAAITLASAATVNIGAALSSNITISGTTTITAFDTVADGITRNVTFSGALILTHNATSLILPGAANILTAAGDCATFLSLGSGNWKCTKYTPSASKPFQIYIPIRQTVLSGPVNSSGLPNFGGSTGSTTVTANGTLIVTAANGVDAYGAIDRIGSITNPSWTGNSTNGTMYAYLDIAADGSCTTGSGALVPIYQWGGTPSIVNGQFTFNIQEMKGYVGNGTTAVQTYRIYVGDFTVSGGVVTVISWYALMGRYDSGYFAITTNTTYAKAHNLGIAPQVFRSWGATDSTGGGSGEWLIYQASGPASGGAWLTNMNSTKSIGLNTDGSAVRINAGSTSYATATHARVIVQRGW